MKILQVLTSHDQLGNTGRKTGFWLEEERPRILFSEMLVSISRWPLRKAGSLRSIQRSICRKIKLRHVVPFLVEDELLRLGAIFEKKGKLATRFRR